MVDKREQILSRLHTVLGEVPGVGANFRNALTVNELAGAIVLLLDGDESRVGSAYDRSRGSKTPIAVEMTPEVHVFLTEAPDEVGTTLNTLRKRVIDAVMWDDGLRALALDNDIRYEGLINGLSVAQDVVAQMAFQFTFRYLFAPEQPEDLTEAPTA